MQVPPDSYPYKRNFALIIFCYFQPVLLSSFPYASTLIVRILPFHFSSAALSSIDASVPHSSVLQAEKSPSCERYRQLGYTNKSEFHSHPLSLPP